MASPSPNPGGAQSDELSGVSCPSTTTCFAVGNSAGPVAYSAVFPVIERWDGEQWSIVNAPEPQEFYGAVWAGVSCSSTTSCVVAGESAGGFTSFPLIDQWDGTNWSVSNVKPTQSTNLAAVSCVSATDCFTVGAHDVPTYNTAPHSTTLIEHGPPAAPPALKSNRPIVGIAATSTGRGYWLVASDGGVFSFGDAHFYGSTGALRLNRPIVGIAATSSGHGYWLAGSDGGVFSFGDAHFYGSTGALRLNRPIVGIAATPSGHGYWLVASDGGIFTFGDAHFYGSAAKIRLNQPIVGMAATQTGHGYWLAASDGGVFGFGDAPYDGWTGSLTETSAHQPIVGIAAAPPDGNGYWLVASDGWIFPFGGAQDYAGSTGGMNFPIVGMAARPPVLHGYWLVASSGQTFGF